MASTASHRHSLLVAQEMQGDEVPSDVDEVQARILADEDSDVPVRHLFIDWPSASVKGTYTIGAGCPDASPPLYDMPKPEVVHDNAASAVFKTRSSPINVTVHVLHGTGAGSQQRTPLVPPQTPPQADGVHVNPAALSETLQKNTVFVHAKSVRNSVTVRVPQYVGRRPLHIRCKSTAGNVTVYLPHSFNGLLSYSVENGNLHLSPEARAHATRIGNEQSKRRGTLKVSVPPELPAWMTGNGKRGDVCELTTNTGRLTVCMAGEKVGGHGCVVC